MVLILMVTQKMLRAIEGTWVFQRKPSNYFIDLIDVVATATTPVSCFGTATGALEIKSGYGLTLDSEIKMLRVIKRIKQKFPIKIKATFLGAHAVPEEFKNNKAAYMYLVCNEMLPRIAGENLADFIDIFCETGYFDLDDLKQIIEAGDKYGIKAKVHVNQFNSFATEYTAKYNFGNISKLYIEPCYQTTNVVSLAHSLTPLKDDFSSFIGRASKMSVKIRIEYAMKGYKKATNNRAFGILSLWSQIGGFVGIFLGYSLLQLPSLVWKNIQHTMNVMRKVNENGTKIL